MSDALATALARLSDALAVRSSDVRRDARWRVAALKWNLIGAPDVAFDLTRSAAEQFAAAGSQPCPTDPSEMGAYLAREMRAERDAGQLSRFALESGVRCLHSSGDLIAQVVRTSVLACRDEHCDLATLVEPKRKRRCRGCGIEAPEHAALLATLSRYRHSPELRYFEAVSNRLKHRNLVPSRSEANRDPESGDVRVAQVLCGFTHDGRRVRCADLRILRHRADRLRLLACAVATEVAEDVVCGAHDACVAGG